MSKIIPSADFKYVTETVFDQLKFKSEIRIEPCDKPGIYVSVNNGKAEIGAQSKTFVARGAMLLALHVTKGEKEFEINQMPHFDTCGTLIDVSTDSFKIDVIKQILVIKAALGMNIMYLYLEDMFELEGYPCFGYMRGRYTRAQLKEIDDFAYSMGIEVIPTVQTLGHLSQFLRWRESYNLVDSFDTLRCDSEDTYTFIEAMIKQVADTFRSSKIHIGMDEAFIGGKSEYEKKKRYYPGYEELYLKHLNRVCDICKRYSKHPMIWSDMPFVLRSDNSKYNGANVEFDDEFINKLPDVDLVYWEYDRTEGSYYEAMLKKHKALGKKTVFAGAVSSFLTFLPSLRRTINASVPALNECVKNGVKDVFATIWGGDGAECPLYMTIMGLPVFSEYCYRGMECENKDIKEIMSFVTGFDYDWCMLASDYESILGKRYLGRRIFYGDIFWGTLGPDFPYEKAADLYGEALKNISKKKCGYDEFNKLALILFEILQLKVPLFYMRKDYEANNLQTLRSYVRDIERLIELYKELWSLREKIWNKYQRIFGWEILTSRYATSVARLEYSKKVLVEFINGERTVIDELAEKLEDINSIVPIPIYNRMAFSRLPIV